jgi:hypothetical protein
MTHRGYPRWMNRVTSLNCPQACVFISKADELQLVMDNLNLISTTDGWASTCRGCYVLGILHTRTCYSMTVFATLNAVSLSSISFSDFSTFTTCAYVGPLLMSARSFLSASSSPWASPSTYMSEPAVFVCCVPTENMPELTFPLTVLRTQPVRPCSVAFCWVNLLDNLVSMMTLISTLVGILSLPKEDAWMRGKVRHD